MLSANIIHHLSPAGDYPVSINQYNDYGWHHEILSKFQQLLTHAASMHNKVFFMSFTVTFPLSGDASAYPPDNRYFICFISKLMTTLKRDGLSPLYLWTREHASYGQHQHYHVYLLLNGSKTCSCYMHLLKAESLWNSTIGLPQGNHGLINHDAITIGNSIYHNGIMLRRDSLDYEATLSLIFTIASYACKAYSKGNAGKGNREYGSSLLHMRSY